MLKKVISMMLCLVVIMSICSISASASDLICVNYTYTYSCDSNMTISNKTITAKSSVIGYNGTTTKVVIKQTLQKKTSSGTWTSAGTASSTTNGYRATLSKKYTGLSSGKYRLKSVFTVYAGNNSETITKYSSEKTV